MVRKEGTVTAVLWERMLEAQVRQRVDFWARGFLSGLAKAGRVWGDEGEASGAVELRRPGGARIFLAPECPAHLLRLGAVEQGRESRHSAGRRRVVGLQGLLRRTRTARRATTGSWSCFCRGLPFPTARRPWVGPTARRPCVARPGRRWDPRLRGRAARFPPLPAWARAA
jgi:hypothetical protein